MTIEFRELTPNDYEQLVELWEHQKVIGDIPCATSRDAYEHYLSHNACLSLGAIDNENLVGAILCGQQGTQGMIEHVTLHEDYFNHSQGTPLINLLINRAMNKLVKNGYTKCTITIAEESIKQNFWTSIRWNDQPDLSSFITVDHIKLQEYQDHEAAMLLQTDDAKHHADTFENPQPDIADEQTTESLSQNTNNIPDEKAA